MLLKRFALLPVSTNEASFHFPVKLGTLLAKIYLPMVVIVAVFNIMNITTLILHSVLSIPKVVKEWYFCHCSVHLEESIDVCVCVSVCAAECKREIRNDFTLHKRECINSNSLGALLSKPYCVDNLHLKKAMGTHQAAETQKLEILMWINERKGII